jgi:short-subunit dehydrogenase
MALRPIALITGASSGIGAELARVFAAHGHELVLVARREPVLTALAQEIETSGYQPPTILPFDLTRIDAPARIGHELASRGLAPAFVVNAAGFGLFGPAADLDRTEQLAMIDVNVRALTDLSLRWVDSLAQHRGGILNVASVAGFLPGAGFAVYHAAKAYVLSFSEALHRELQPRGIRVTVLCPGPVPTGFQERAGIGRSTFPRLLSRKADRIARDGYKGLIEGRRIVVPGFPNKVATMLPRFLPRSLMLKLGDSSKRHRAKPAAPTGWPRRPSAR